MIEITLLQRAVFIPHCGVSRFAQIARIQATIAESCGISISQIKSARRNRSIAWPRQVAMYLARELTDKSLPHIGREFGKRDHTTVSHAIEAVKQRMAADPIYRADVEALREALSA